MKQSFLVINLDQLETMLTYRYDKNTNSKLKKDYVSNTVLPSPPWSDDSRTALDALLDRIIFLYRRVVTSGDEDLAKEQLRSQLREKVVVDRETVWSQMVSGHRDGIFRSVTPEFQVGNKGGRRWRTPFGRIGVPEWVSAKGLIFCAAVGVFVGIVLGQPMKRVEESNCLAMLVFCTILWATEVSPFSVLSPCRGYFPAGGFSRRGAAERFLRKVYREAVWGSSVCDLSLLPTLEIRNKEAATFPSLKNDHTNIPTRPEN